MGGVCGGYIIKADEVEKEGQNASERKQTSVEKSALPQLVKVEKH